MIPSQRFVAQAYGAGRRAETALRHFRPRAPRALEHNKEQGAHARGERYSAMTSVGESATASRIDPAKPSVRAGNRLLGALRAADFALIEPHLELVSLHEGTVLFEPGEEVETAYLPCHRTMISLRLPTRRGEEVEAATIGREGALGGIVSAGVRPAYGRAVVQLPGPAYAIAVDRLAAAKARSAALHDLFARYADVLLAQVMQSAACGALHQIDQRCCRWLLSAHDRAGDRAFHFTQQALADMLGVQRTTVTAVCRRLEKAGLISHHRGEMEIVDRPRLERAACECYAAVEAHYARMLPEVDAG